MGARPLGALRQQLGGTKLKGNYLGALRQQLGGTKLKGNYFCGYANKKGRIPLV
jgi:hypothetical protein